MNWGYKIAIAYSVFVILILGLVYMSSLQNIDLVTEEYYAEELVYQQQIDKKINADNLENPLTIKQEKNQLRIQFPTEIALNGVEGTLFFYKPDDKKKDNLLNIAAEKNGLQLIDVTDFAKGYYQLKIEWQSNGISYYQEEDIFI